MLLEAGVQLRSASFPADCDGDSLPFHAGDNSAPALWASCVGPRLLPVSAVVRLRVVVAAAALSGPEALPDARAYGK